MKQLVCVIAATLALFMGSTAFARDGDGRSFTRGHSYRHDYRGHRDYGYRDHKYYGGRKFYDRDYGRRYYDRYRPYRGHRYDRFYGRKYYGGRKFYHDGYGSRRGSW